MANFQLRVVIKIDYLSPRNFKEDGQDKVVVIIMIEVANRIGLVQVVVIDIDDKIIKIDLSMDKTIRKGLKMVRIMEKKTLGEETIKKCCIIFFH